MTLLSLKHGQKTLGLHHTSGAGSSSKLGGRDVRTLCFSYYRDTLEAASLMACFASSGSSILEKLKDEIQGKKFFKLNRRGQEELKEQIQLYKHRFNTNIQI